MVKLQGADGQDVACEKLIMVMSLKDLLALVVETENVQADHAAFDALEEDLRSTMVPSVQECEIAV